MKLKIAAALAIVAVFAGVIYFSRGPSTASREAAAPAANQEPGAQRPPAPPPPPTSRSVSQLDAAAKPIASDPRLAALMVTPDNGLIEFVKGPNGKVIQEIDKDPHSYGFRKPLREYTWNGDQVVQLTSYQYFADHVQVDRTRVSYKPDGSVDKFDQSSSQESAHKATPAG